MKNEFRALNCDMTTHFELLGKDKSVEDFYHYLLSINFPHRVSLNGNGSHATCLTVSPYNNHNIKLTLSLGQVLCWNLYSVNVLDEKDIQNLL